MNNFKKKYCTVFAGLIIYLAVFFAGCDETLEPFKENDRFIFSIYGWLDASDENHWIRVINLQEEVDRSGGGINGTVTLENLSTGEQTTFSDSLFQYTDNIFAYNFFANTPLKPSETYKLRATRTDGAESSVTIRMPGSFPDPVFQRAAMPGDPDGLRIRGVENLAEVSVRFDVRFIQAEFTQPMRVSVLADSIRTGSDEFFITIDTGIIADATVDLDSIEITNCEIYVARAGPGWLHFPSIDRNLIALPEGISNIENGTGYVIGVVSRRIVYPNARCVDQD